MTDFIMNQMVKQFITSDNIAGIAEKLREFLTTFEPQAEELPPVITVVPGEQGLYFKIMTFKNENFVLADGTTTSRIVYSREVKTYNVDHPFICELIAEMKAEKKQK